MAGDETMPLRCEARVSWVGFHGRRSLELQAGRRGYLLALAGPIRVGDATLAAGDGAEVRGGEVVLESDGAASAIWFDVALSLARGEMKLH